MALRRLSRPASLLILDNVHHQPELARRLWDQWRERPYGSTLLLVATRMQRTVTTAPAQDLGFSEHHAINPAVELRPKADDLGVQKSSHQNFFRVRHPFLPLPDPCKAISGGTTSRRPVGLEAHRQSPAALAAGAIGPAVA